MTDDANYTDNIRKLTTAAEQDDAVTAGKLLSDLGPEQWDRAIKDMLALNQKDIKDNIDSQNWSVFIPPLSVEMDKAGTKETLTVFQQPAFSVKDPLPVAKITEDISGRKIDTPSATNGDVVRQITTAAEQGNAVETARILQSLGPEKWAQVTKDMVDLNLKDIRTRPDLNTHVPFISVGYERNGTEETISIFQAPESQTSLPLAKVTGRK